MTFLDRLGKEILFYDGAMGTLLQASGVLKPGMAPELLNLEHPDAVRGVHEQYRAAGVDIVETNTFGGSKLKLKQFGLAGKFKEINAAAVRIARAVMRGHGFVAAATGPLEQMVEPLGPITFDETVALYTEWVEVVANEKPDVILFETFSDIYELKAAIIAARSVTNDIPIQAQLTFEEGKQTVSGTPPDAAAVTLSAMDVQVIGTNCSSGPEQLIGVVDRYYAFGSAFISVQPNAGMPELVDGKMVFKTTPDAMARYARAFVEKGAHVLGGCCGTTPAHIAAMKKAVAGMRPRPRPVQSVFRASSRTKVFSYDERKRPFVIGERVNPTGKKMLSAELVEGKTTLVRKYAIEQTRKGAHLLDVNVGTSGCNEPDMMKKAVRAMQAVSDLPLVIDSSNPAVLEVGLREAAGKVMINSVNGEQKSLDRVLPLAKKYGAAVLGLTLDDKGIPANEADRMAIVQKIARAAKRAGVPTGDIVIDPLTLTVATEPQQARETLHAVAAVKKQYGFLTSLGLSNISFGLPDRERINTEFLSLAGAFGLDFAIANPNDELLMAAVRSQARCEKTDAAIDAFVQDARTIQSNRPKREEKKDGETARPLTKDELLQALHEAILYGDKESIGGLVEQALASGFGSGAINTQYLVPALEEVGRKFEAKEYFLPHVIMAAEAMQVAFGILKRAMKAEDVKSPGTIVFATVEGDFHDIGKNIVIAVLENYGYRVVDLGRDIKADEIVAAAMREEADIIGMSALMTTTMVRMEEVIASMKRCGCTARTMVGGAVLTQSYADSIGADGYARNAIEAVNIVKRLMK